MNITPVKNFLFKYLQTILLIMGLLTIDVGLSMLVIAPYVVMVFGAEMIVVGLLINYERKWLNGLFCTKDKQYGC